jgi:hypothetical protein
VAVSAANRHDLGLLLPLIRAVPPVRGKRGRPRQRPDCIIADRGYDSRLTTRHYGSWGSRPLLAARGSPHGSGLGVWRWPVERSFAWLHSGIGGCASAGNIAPRSTMRSLSLLSHLLQSAYPVILKSTVSLHTNGR